MTDSFIGRQFYKSMKKQIGQMIQGQEDSPVGLLLQSIVDEMPLRSIMMMSDGALNRKQLEALLLMINGHFFKGGWRRF